MNLGILALSLALSANTTDDARRVSAKLDEFIAAGYTTAKVKPAALADDAAFLRRVTLDIAGRIPTVAETRKFLADTSPEKRARAVEQLLDGVGYTNHFTRVWADLLVPEAKSDVNNRFLLMPMHRWLRAKFSDNVTYDRMVRELVAMPITRRDAFEYYREAFGGGASAATPVSFYLGKLGKPDDIAAATSRLFLGVRLECAQCHDHPFGKWTRDEFWGQAAFFAGIKGPTNVFNGQLSEVSDRRELAIPNTDRVAQARFLDGKAPKWKFKTGARTTLAQWMTARDNPFFAKALVNRYWAHFFGVGLVDPVDDLVDSNPASHPELLDHLAKEFAAHDFDLKFLIKALVLSRTYQLSSRVADPAKAPPERLFARMPVRSLTGEQLYDSVGVASGNRDTTGAQQRVFGFGGPRQLFLDQFPDQERRTEHHTAIPQALTMMNGDLIANATHPDRGRTLSAVIEAPFLDTPAKVETLFLAALSRKPTPAEAARCLAHVKKATNKAGQRKAYADVFWALLNSTEFITNH
jgi:hypothetical protein